MNTGGIVPPMQQKTPAQGVSFQSDPLMRSQFKGYMSGLADKSMQNVMSMQEGGRVDRDFGAGFTDFMEPMTFDTSPKSGFDMALQDAQMGAMPVGPVGVIGDDSITSLGSNVLGNIVSGARDLGGRAISNIADFFNQRDDDTSLMEGQGVGVNLMIADPAMGQEGGFAPQDITFRPSVAPVNLQNFIAGPPEKDFFGRSRGPGGRRMRQDLLGNLGGDFATGAFPELSAEDLLATLPTNEDLRREFLRQSGVSDFAETAGELGGGLGGDMIAMPTTITGPTSRPMMTSAQGADMDIVTGGSRLGLSPGEAAQMSGGALPGASSAVLDAIQTNLNPGPQAGVTSFRDPDIQARIDALRGGSRVTEGLGAGLDPITQLQARAGIGRDRPQTISDQLRGLPGVGGAVANIAGGIGRGMTRSILNKIDEGGQPVQDASGQIVGVVHDGLFGKVYTGRPEFNPSTRGAVNQLGRLGRDPVATGLVSQQQRDQGEDFLGDIFNRFLRRNETVPTTDSGPF